MKYLFQVVRFSMFAGEGRASSALRALHRVAGRAGSAECSTVQGGQAESRATGSNPHPAPGSGGRGEPLLSERAREEVRTTLKKADESWATKGVY